MQNLKSHKILNAASLATLAVAFMLSLPVVERLVAAIWQWYKFFGYPTEGQIGLSLRTGQFFTVLVVVTFVFSLLFNQLAKRHAVSRAKTWSFLAMCITVANVSAYWLLGLSNLNIWRA